MQNSKLPDLRIRQSGGGEVHQINGQTWRLSIPAGPDRVYRWAQLDDYLQLPRRAFPWRLSCYMELQARVSAPNLLGTWGFGFWNDPFSMSFGLGGMSRRIPTLPNTAWFFFASPPNYLSLRDDLPANGFLAATFRSTRIPTPLLVLSAPLAPLLAWQWAARKLRHLGCRFIQQSSTLLHIDPTKWHTYGLEWEPDKVVFWIDGEPVFTTAGSPHGPLGLVLWIDNQYASFSPQGRLSFGTLPNPHEEWLELAEIHVK